MSDSKSTDVEQFDWVTLKRDMDDAAKVETVTQKLNRKVFENPFVPLGCLATVAALSYGLWSFRTGNRQMSQYMMRARIAAQAFTIVAVLAGLGMSLKKSND